MKAKVLEYGDEGEDGGDESPGYDPQLERVSRPNHGSREGCSLSLTTTTLSLDLLVDRVTRTIGSP